MYIFGYALKRMSRDAVKCLILLLAALSFTVLINELSLSLDTQYGKLDEAYDGLLVDAVITDAKGITTKVYSEYIAMFDEENGQYGRYVKDICLKRTIEYLAHEGARIGPGDDLPSLIGISRVSADNNLSAINGVEITYMDGYDEKMFQSSGYVCIIPEYMLEQSIENADEANYSGVRVTEDGYIEIYGYVYLYTREYATVPLKLKVAGTYTGGGYDIYCPWLIMNEIAGLEFAGDLYSEGLSFTIKDNHMLDEFKKDVSEHFVATGYEGGAAGGIQYAITVMDSQLIQTSTSLKRNISMLEKIKPILFVLSAGTGFIACMLFIKNRKPEFANMRSMGASKGSVFAEAFFEQSVLCITGVSAGIGIYLLIHGSSVAVNITELAVFIVCYLSGASIEVINITRINVMKIMKARE
jgi:hypothetical protein